jgi:Rap1a immunity proteins
MIAKIFMATVIAGAAFTVPTVLSTSRSWGAEPNVLISDVRFDQLVGWCEDSDVGKRAICFGYMTGLIDGRSYADMEFGQRVLCYKDDVTFAAADENVIAQLKNNFHSKATEGLRSVRASVPVLGIARDNFPCPTTAAAKHEFRPASYDPSNGMEEMTSPQSGGKIYVTSTSLLTDEDIAAAQAATGPDGPPRSSAPHQDGRASVPHLELPECRSTVGDTG